jgi:multidrug efflux pump subunit AcrB
MALNISAWSIRNPLPSVVFSIILLILGWVSFTKLAVTRLPSADIPVISVAVSQFGAAPAELGAATSATEVRAKARTTRSTQAHCHGRSHFAGVLT